MKQDENLIHETQEQETVTPKTDISSSQSQLQSGEKVFHIFLFAMGLFAFILALQLWFQMSEPRISSAAALPLFVSGAWTIMSLIGIIENIKMTTPLTQIKDASQKLHEALKYAFPKEVLVLLLAILVYCMLLIPEGQLLYLYAAVSLWRYVLFNARQLHQKHSLDRRCHGLYYRRIPYGIRRGIPLSDRR